MLIGGFQGASDPTDAGWTVGGTSITTSPQCSFPAIGVPGQPLSLQITNDPAGFGDPTLEFAAGANCQVFVTNSWLTFTFSVAPSSNTGGYNQIYNVQWQFPNAGGVGVGYTNLPASSPNTWSTLSQAEAVAGEGVGNDSSGQPGYGLYSGYGLQSQTVTINISSMTNFINQNAVGHYCNLVFQFNNGGGGTTYGIEDMNAVVMSQGPFGAVAPSEPVGTFIVDDFASSGVSPSNPTNDDYFNVAEDYVQGQITNVWNDWFTGTGMGSTSTWVSASSVATPSYAPSQGSLKVQWTWGGNSGDTSYANQVALWESANTYGIAPFGVGTPYYTNFSCDIMFPATSTVGADNTFGQMQFGDVPAVPTSGNAPGNGQDWFGGANYTLTVSNSQAGVWQHISIPLNPTDTAEQAGGIAGVAIHWTAGYNGGADSTMTGPGICYIDNVEFEGPATAPAPTPAPTLTIKPAVPALRMFVGNADTYLREGIISAPGTGQDDSWIGGSYPVTYSFQLLDYPSAQVNGTGFLTEFCILPENSWPSTANYQTTIYSNPYLDYQDSNGLYLAISPYSGTQVVGRVQWMTNNASGANASYLYTVLTVTNQAVGTWTLTMNNATSGTLTPPGGNSQNFTISDPNVGSDFGNPAVAVLLVDPNAAAGYGAYEDIGTVSITGVAGGNQTENFSAENGPFNSGTSPGGYFQNNYSVDTNNLVISENSGNNLDKYWVDWNQDLKNDYYLVTATNIATPPSQWISPLYYSGYNIPDETAPYGQPITVNGVYWTLLPQDDLPTSDRGAQSSPPAINDPLAPHAYFLLTTNNANIYP